MKTEIIYAQISFNYNTCLKEECPQADTCLRQLTTELTKENVYFLRPNKKRVLNILKNCGVAHPQDFDVYTEKYDW